MASGASVRVATFNVHGGIDGWGRPLDLTEACRRLDADVVALEESFVADGGPSQAALIADDLGYSVVEVPYASLLVKRLSPGEGPRTGRWGPRPGSRAPKLYRSVAVPGRQPKRTAATADFTAGTLGLALMSRLPLRLERVVDLVHLPKDPVQRCLAVASLEVGAGQSLWVVATHLGHLQNGSLRQVRQLGRYVDGLNGPVVALGDMNCWGPLLDTGSRTWRRAVVARSWPSWRPHSQIDHVLVRGLSVLGGEALRPSPSDHLPVVVTVALEATEPTA